MPACVTFDVPHAKMTNSRHKFGKLFTPDVNSYIISGLPKCATWRENAHLQNSTQERPEREYGIFASWG